MQISAINNVNTQFEGRHNDHSKATKIACGVLATTAAVATVTAGVVYRKNISKTLADFQAKAMPYINKAASKVKDKAAVVFAKPAEKIGQFMNKAKEQADKVLNGETVTKIRTGISNMLVKISDKCESISEKLRKA